MREESKDVNMGEGGRERWEEGHIHVMKEGERKVARRVSKLSEGIKPVTSVYRYLQFLHSILSSPSCSLGLCQLRTMSLSLLPAHSLTPNLSYLQLR